MISDCTFHNSSSNVEVNSPAHVFGAHTLCGRTRVGMMNDPQRNQKYCQALSKVGPSPQTYSLAPNEQTVWSMLNDYSV